MADNDKTPRDPLQAQSGGEQQAMQMGQEGQGQQQGQKPQASDSERQDGGGMGRVDPQPGGQSAGEMAQSDAGYGSSAAVKQGGLGAQQTTYGQSTQQDASGGMGSQSVNLGAQGQTGNLGKSPGHDKNLSTGLKDQNQGTSGGGL